MKAHSACRIMASCKMLLEGAVFYFIYFLKNLQVNILNDVLERYFSLIVCHNYVCNVEIIFYIFRHVNSSIADALDEL